MQPEKRMMTIIFLSLLLVTIIGIMDMIRFFRKDFMRSEEKNQDFIARVRRQRIESSNVTESINSMDRMEDFDWMTYIDRYVDLQRNNITNREEAVRHFQHFGQFEGRVFPRIRLNRPCYAAGIEKMSNYINDHAYLSFESRAPSQPGQDLLFVSYNVEESIQYDIGYNNLMIFLFSIQSTLERASVNPRVLLKGNTSSQSGIRCFYWLNVIGNNKYHELDKLSFRYRNLAVINWASGPSTFYNHMRSLSVVRGIIEIKFSTVFLLSNRLRGPHTTLAPTSWILNLLTLFRNECIYKKCLLVTNIDQLPSLNGAFFSSTLIPLLPTIEQLKDQHKLRQQNDYDWWSNNISHALYMHQVFVGLWIESQIIPLPSTFSTFSSIWCESFLFRSHEVSQLCEAIYQKKDLNIDSLMPLDSVVSKALEHSSFPIKSPEVVPCSPSYYHLTVEHQKEISHPWSQLLPSESTPTINPAICLLVRTARLHDIEEDSLPGIHAYHRHRKTGVQDLIECKE